jgi:hypothetical protein
MSDNSQSLRVTPAAIAGVQRSVLRNLQKLMERVERQRMNMILDLLGNSNVKRGRRSLLAMIVAGLPHRKGRHEGLLLRAQ